MTSTARPKSAPKRGPKSDQPAARRPSAAAPLPGHADEATSTPQWRGPTILFGVPFASAMSDHDVALLVRTLDLTTHMSPERSGSPASPGAVRLDHYSGLFLEHGPADGRWVLEARTWGHPAPETVHEWRVLAAGAARLLDPAVMFPDRMTTVSPAYPMIPVGRAANNRHARIGRRILGPR
jgi:hypothetical protein